MKITFLGTGAADFSPLLKIEYKNKLSKDHRRSSSILIEEQFLVDCGPHTAESFRLQGLDTSKVTDLFLTHFHDDHYDRDSIAQIAAQTAEPLRIWHRAGATPEPMEHVVFCPVEVGEKFTTCGMKAVGYAANHTDFPLHYDLEWQGKKLFYGCDGGWYLCETMYAISHREYDIMLVDGTVGDYNGDFRVFEHNSIPMLRMLKPSFEERKVIGPQGQIWLQHVAPTLHKPHDETEKFLRKDDLFIAYDGLTLEI